MAARMNLLSVCLLAACAVCFLNTAFVSAPAQPRAAAATVAALAAAGAPLVAFASDDLLEYNMAGEFTTFMTGGYFAVTLGYTAISFVSYLLLTKLKII
eukprot:CAMPEP_0183503540 /NCGR_PEP_ID=MMETSP0371-20130417/5226_1 /TAXON_ID=268820 /ORGANISM="Peridinium aciculiferum, Strain PAER-2" /LENGTH=98 /DNA_ID=CAMNT_0025698693 /DNA_START=71 /DNA_END=367 /DNA_ORIENTATION=-